MHREKRKVMQFQGSARDPGGGKSDGMVYMNVAGRANTTEALYFKRSVL